ncbi:MAG: hypothetical protein MJ246_00575 [Clostridia bacterium]|nr:hypothetical protein [Clostridia bacterium]
MLIKVKRYSLAAFISLLLSFMPLLLFYDSDAALKAPLATLILIPADILLGLITTSSSLFNEFESYKKSFKVISMGSDPREAKSSELSSYLVNFFLYQVPFIASLFIIDACASSGITKTLIIAWAVMVYNLTIIVMFLIRLKKMFKFINETAEEDDAWAEVKWDVTKLIRELTLENHLLELTPQAYKDTTFMKYQEEITSRIKRIKSYQVLDDEKKLIVLTESVMAACMFMSEVCSRKYVEL